MKRTVVLVVTSSVLAAALAAGVATLVTWRLVRDEGPAADPDARAEALDDIPSGEIATSEVTPPEPATPPTTPTSTEAADTAQSPAPEATPAEPATPPTTPTEPEEDEPRPNTESTPTENQIAVQTDETEAPDDIPPEEIAAPEVTAAEPVTPSVTPTEPESEKPDSDTATTSTEAADTTKSPTPKDPPPEPEAAEPSTSQSNTAESGRFSRPAEPRAEDTLIAANGKTTCAVLLDGGLSCWGEDGLQHRLTASGFDDVAAVTLSDTTFDNYATAICVLHRDGTVSCWGDGYDGRLGQDNDLSASLAKQVPGISDAVAVSAASGHICVLHKDGEVSCWGQGIYGQMGDGTTIGKWSPQRVPGLQDIVAIATGYGQTCGVHSDGSVSCWGTAWHEDRLVPTEISGLDDVESVAAGLFSACAVHSDSRVSCWEYRGNGRYSPPALVPQLDDVVAISHGGDAGTSDGTFCALHHSGEVSCWGNNSRGQIGDGTFNRAVRPVRLSHISDAVAVTVSSPNRDNEMHACALIESGEAYCWGSNGYGQLGTGDRDSRVLPTQVEVVRSGRLAVDLPVTEMDFVRTFVELVVQDNEEQFPWLRIAWESVRERVRISGLGTYGAAVWHECRLDNSIYQCEPTKVAFNPQFGIDEDGITHEFAHVYDFNTGLTPTRAWGAVQLYFNVTYEDCYPEIESIGSEFLADTMSHLIEPTAWLTYFESLIHPENGCYEYDREPSLLDEEVVLAGLAGNIPDWYTENITNGAELWAAFLSRPGDALLANIMHEFGGLCTTDWIRFPLDPDLFPAEGTNPFADGGC